MAQTPDSPPFSMDFQNPISQMTARMIQKPPPM